MSNEIKKYERIICGMNEEKFQVFLEKLPEDMKMTMVVLRATHKLFTDVAYHKCMKQSFLETVASKMWEEANAR